MMRRLFLVSACTLALLMFTPGARAQVDTDTPTETPTDTPPDTPTETPPADTPTDTPVDTPTDTPAVPTETATDTPAVPTETATDTPVAVPTDTATDTPVVVATDTPTDTPVVVPTETPTETPVVGPTDTATETPVVVATDTPTDTPVGGVTETPTETPTDTPVVGPSDTPTDTPIVGPTGTATDTPLVAATSTDTPVPPNTPVDTQTATQTPLPTNTLPPTMTYTPTIPMVQGSSVTIRPLVQAQCAGPASCNSLGITFGKGRVRIKLVRPPSAVGDREVGKIHIKRVFRPQPLLSARVVGDISYGGDPDGDCPLANTQTLGAIYATGTLTCKTKRGASNCEGILALPAFVPGPCTDVGVVVSNAHIEVYDINAPGSLSSLIARDGLKIRGSR